MALTTEEQAELDQLSALEPPAETTTSQGLSQQEQTELDQLSQMNAPIKDTEIKSGLLLSKLSILITALKQSHVPKCSTA